MAFLAGTDGGGAVFTSSVVTVETYDPVYDISSDSQFIWEVLPSFYKDLMSDKDIYESLWNSKIQEIAAELLNLWQAGYSSNLRDVPVISQRKWILFDFEEEVDLESDPLLTTFGLENKFVYNEIDDVIDGNWEIRAGVDKAILALRGDTDQDGSLIWSFVMSTASAQKKAAALVGYFNSAASKILTNALTAGVIGDSSTDDTPRPAIVHIDPAGVATSTFGAEDLELDTEYRFNCEYRARDGTVIAVISEVRASKQTGASGETLSSATEDPYTGEFKDDAVNFDTLGIVEGDILVFEGEDYTITSVDGSNLVVDPASLPEEATGLTYEIVGEEEVQSISIDLPGDAGDPTFTVNQFGTSNLDLRSIDSSFFTLPGKANRRVLTGYTKDWSYMDPTSEYTLLAVPRLQEAITDPQTLLYEGVDYEITNSAFEFQEPPPVSLWAEYAGFDEGQIADNFGRNVNLVEVSSDDYKSKVRGLYYAYFQGPTPYAIEIGVHILVGLPIADKAGEVESIDPTYSGLLGRIRVAGRDYLYPLAVGTTLSVGDEVEAFEPLSEGVEVLDYKNSPTWWIYQSSFNEIEKYNTFAVRLNLDAFEVSSLTLAAEFVEEIRPPRKKARFFAFKALEDDFEVDDEFSMVVQLILFDVPCDQVIVRYDSKDFEGDEHDWRYSQGDDASPDWDETSAAMRGTATELDGVATFNSGSTAVNGSGTAWSTDLTASDYIAIGLYRTGSAGQTIAGSNLFKDETAGAFSGVEAGDRITVTGEGTGEVQSVTDDNNIILDFPMSATATGVAWETIGRFKYWEGIASITDDDDMDTDANFPWATDTYKIAKLNEDYRRAFYDQFREQCPDEDFTINIEYTAGGAPGVTNVPDAPFQTQTTFNFAIIGDTHSVTLDERIP
jgi:hypothetical protein